MVRAPTHLAVVRQSSLDQRAGQPPPVPRPEPVPVLPVPVRL